MKKMVVVDAATSDPHDANHPDEKHKNKKQNEKRQIKRPLSFFKSCKQYLATKALITGLPTQTHTHVGNLPIPRNYP